MGCRNNTEIQQPSIFFNKVFLFAGQPYKRIIEFTLARPPVLRPVLHKARQLRRTRSSLLNLKVLSEMAQVYEDQQNVPMQMPIDGSSYVIYKNEVLVTGGIDSERGICTSNCFIYKKEIFNRQENLSARRFFHSSTLLNQYLYVFGGMNSQMQALNVCERFSLKQRVWQKLPSFQLPRAQPLVVVLQSQIILIGGTNQGLFVDKVQIFNTQNMTWVQSSIMLPALNYAFPVSQNSTCLQLAAIATSTGIRTFIIDLDSFFYKLGGMELPIPQITSAIYNPTALFNKDSVVVFSAHNKYQIFKDPAYKQAQQTKAAQHPVVLSKISRTKQQFDKQMRIGIIKSPVRCLVGLQGRGLRALYSPMRKEFLKCSYQSISRLSSQELVLVQQSVFIINLNQRKFEEIRPFFPRRKIRRVRVSSNQLRVLNKDRLGKDWISRLSLQKLLSSTNSLSDWIQEQYSQQGEIHQKLREGRWQFFVEGQNKREVPLGEHQESTIKQQVLWFS